VFTIKWEKVVEKGGKVGITYQGNGRIGSL